MINTFGEGMARTTRQEEGKPGKMILMILAHRQCSAVASYNTILGEKSEFSVKRGAPVIPWVR
jgi:hypothetical protein